MNSFETLRHRIALILLPTGSLAAIAGTLFGASNHQTLIDTLLLPFMAVYMALSFFGLWLGRLPLNLIERGLVILLGVYQFVSLCDFSWSGQLVQTGLSATALWYPLFYLLAYMFFEYHLATRVSVSYLALTVVVTLSGFAIGAPGNTHAINTIVQFLIANIIYLLMIGLFSRYRYEYSTMNRLAHTDALTALPNRRAIDAVLERYLERANQGGESFTVLVLDLDAFKSVNDRYGHATGDEVLRTVAERLERTLRPNDLVARWGGEEFLVLARNTSLEQAELLRQRLQHAVSDRPVWQSLQVTVSVGLAAFESGETLEHLFKRADADMYRDKQHRQRSLTH